VVRAGTRSRLFFLAVFSFWLLRKDGARFELSREIELIDDESSLLNSAVALAADAGS
jgi:hypothetical protein